MPNQLSLDYQVRVPLLEHVAQRLRNEFSDILQDAALQVTVTFHVATSTEFLDRVNQLDIVHHAPLVELSDQISGSITFATVESISTAESVIGEHFTIVAKQWFNDNNLLPNLKLTCVIPPQAKPDGWHKRNDVPSVFLLLLLVHKPVIIDDSISANHTLLHVADPNEPLALIMKGGGIKGLAYVGAIDELSKKYTFNWFVGTSAGAIAAVLLGAGYTSDELKAILKSKNFNDFFDASWWRKWFNLILYRGLHPADTLTEWLDTLLALKLQKPTRVKLSELPFRVTVYASQRNKRALRFDSIDNDVDAAYAVRCSMSIPFVFVPQSNQGLRTYDGGMQHNYPVDELLNKYPGTAFVSLYLGPEVYEPVKQGWILSDLLSIWTEAGDAEALAKYRDNTVIIDPRPIGTLDFTLSSLEKDYLLACGRTSALTFISKDSIEHTTTKEIRDSLKSQIVQIRRKKKTRRFIIKAILLCLAVFGLSFMTWHLWLKPVDLSKPHLLYSHQMNVNGVNATDFDLSMPGIVVRRVSVVIDLSNEVLVPPEERDDKKTSPSVHSYTITAVRETDEARYIVYEFASQRRLLDINCISNQPHAVWFRQDGQPVGKGFNNVWTFVVDVNQHSRDIPFTLQFRVTRYNAYQAENKNFVGHIVTANEEEINSKVYLPRAFIIADKPRLLQKRLGDPTAKWTDFDGDADVSITDGGASFVWNMRKPRQGSVYAAEINWLKKNE